MTRGITRYVICYEGVVDILEVASLREAQKNNYGTAAGRKKVEYGGSRALGKAPFEGRAKGSSPHPPLKGKNEGSESYSARSSRCAVMARFPGRP